MATKSNIVKSLIVRSPVHWLVVYIRYFFELLMINLSINTADRTKAYCISPFKSGTTYLAGCFEHEYNVCHEPLMFTTLKHLDSISFLKKRSEYLSLDLECSGFLSMKLSEIRNINRNAPVLFLSRSPEDWIGSVVNYFSSLDNYVSYNYLSDMYFKAICKDDVRLFYSVSTDRRRAIVLSLLNYWLDVYENALLDKKTMVIKLEELNERFSEVEDFLGMKLRKKRKKVWQRKNENKKKFQLKDYVDLSLYKDRISDLGYEV